MQDLQAGLNATDRTIARLQRQLAELRSGPQSARRQRPRIAALTRRIQRPAARRGGHDPGGPVRDRAAAPRHRRPDSRSPAHHGPLHGLGVAFRWIGIGAVYALALGAPLLLVVWLAWIAARTIRRRREDALLSRS